MAPDPAPPSGRASRRRRPDTSISVTSRTPSSCGGWRASRRGRGPACGSRTTTGCAAARSSRWRCSRTSTGSASSPTPARPPVRRRRPVRGRRSRGFAPRASSTAATARARRSRYGRTTTGVGGTDPAARAAVASVASMGRSCASRSAAARSAGWTDRRPCSDEVANDGDPPLTDRDGNWTYGFAVVVDDLRQGVDLVIRGRDLLERDSRADPAGRPARSRDTGRLRAPSADPATGRAKAVEGGRLHLRARPARGRDTAPPRSSRWRPWRSDDQNLDGIEHGRPDMSHHQ